MTAAMPRVLVVDDNPSDRMLLSRILEHEGFCVRSVEDGESALATFDEFQPDFALLDVIMPGLSGLEVAAAIKARHDERLVPVIFLTSLSEPQDLSRCIDAGGDDFISKPYNRYVLKAKLRALDRVRRMHLTIQEQRDEFINLHADLREEQRAAKEIFDKITHSGDREMPFVEHLVSPYSIFNGDVLFAARRPDGVYHLLLGDFTGHGLPAAIGAMPLADVFYEMTHKGFSARKILEEANEKLHRILPSRYFCCAVFLAIDLRAGHLEYWNGGMPAAAWRSAGEAPRYLTSSHLPLGIIGRERFDSLLTRIELAPGDRVLMCTDGILEATNEDQVMFGAERLEDLMRRNDVAVSGIALLREALYHHIGGSDRADDITLAEFTMPAPEGLTAPLTAGGPVAQGSAYHGGEPCAWRVGFELNADALRQADPLEPIHQFLGECAGVRHQAAILRTVIGELFSNALEHGLMRLDSRQKNSAAGFYDYYEARTRALEAIEGRIRIDLEHLREGAEERLQIRVEDSGPGFDVGCTELSPGRDAAAPEQARLHGRGLRLLRQLCDRVEFEDRGNVVKVELSWRNDDETAAG